MVTDVLKSGA